MQAGQQVRLRTDPGRHGVLTGKTRERRGLQLYQVNFADRTSSYVPQDQLELIESAATDPIDLLEKGSFGRAEDLRRGLTHVRLSGRLANIIYSMDTTGTDFYAYQFKPVLKLLESTCNGILIADEVGLGKTIEAGLIWTELRSRFDFRRIFVLCPAVLREKWRQELRLRFGVNAEILTARDARERLHTLAKEGPLGDFAFIASLQGLRPNRGWEDLPDPSAGPSSSALANFLDGRKHEDPLIDLLVVDEAHYLRNPESMTSKLGRLMRDVSQYVVLLSATPVHLKSRDLFQLSNLIDEDSFTQQDAFDEILEANEPLVRIRDRVAAGRISVDEFRSEIEEAEEHPLLRGSHQLGALKESLTTDTDLRDKRVISALAGRLDSVNLLGHVVTRTRKRDVTEWRVLRRVVPEAVDLTPLEMEFYSAVTDVVRDYAERTAGHEAFLIVTPQRQMASSIPAAFRAWKERQTASQEEVYDDLGLEAAGASRRTEEIGPLVRAIMERVDELGNYETLAKTDSKYARLRELILAHFEEHAGEKVVLFTSFRPTVKYLKERLRADGVPSFALMGGMDDKLQTIDEFLSMDGSAVLLSTEVGSEGIDLQRARVLVNYDLPWNPMRVEQRIGRLDRLGQEAEAILIWNVFCAGTIDARIYERLFLRLDIFRRALGALEPVLGKQVKRLTQELLSRRLSPAEEIARIEQTQIALENRRRSEEELESEASHLVAYGDYILNQVLAARELNRRIDSEDLYRYVTDFLTLRYPGTEFRPVGEDPMHVQLGLSADARHDLDQFMRRNKLDASTSLVRNDLRAVECRFKNSAVPERGGRLEIISQFHPLVRFVSDEVRGLAEYRFPAVAVALRAPADEKLPDSGVYVFAVQRWSVRGIQDIEKLHFAAALYSADEDVPEAIDSERAEALIVAAARQGGDWLACHETVEPARAAEIANEVCFAQADRAYEDYTREIAAKNHDRAEVQERTLEKRFQSQLGTLEETRARHASLGRESLMKATEGRIRALKTRVDRRRLEIQKGRELRTSQDEICVGVILLETTGKGEVNAEGAAAQAEEPVS